MARKKKDRESHSGPSNPYFGKFEDEMCIRDSHRMGGGDQADPGTEHAPVADGDGRGVQHDAVVIGIKALAHMDVVAVVAAEIRLYIDVCPRGAEKLLQQRRPRRRLSEGVQADAAAQGCLLYTSRCV